MKTAAFTNDGFFNVTAFPFAANDRPNRRLSRRILLDIEDRAGALFESFLRCVLAASVLTGVGLCVAQIAQS